jgi:hypothetical protein
MKVGSELDLGAEAEDPRWHEVEHAPVGDIGARIAQDLPFAYGNRVRFPLRTGEWVSIEMHVSTPIPEWGGKTWYARYEETAQIDGSRAHLLIPPQDHLLVAGGPAATVTTSR